MNHPAMAGAIPCMVDFRASMTPTNLKPLLNRKSKGTAANPGYPDGKSSWVDMSGGAKIRQISLNGDV